MVKISVVIPTHNRCDLLPRAIRSVQGQTLKDLEIIVVSDGSTDGTDELMKELEAEDERIRYISYKPGKGGNYARNLGLKSATSEYVAFLDDDDEWLPSKLQEQLAIMESDRRCGLVYTGVRIIYVDDGLEYLSIPKESGDLSRSILRRSSVGSTSTVLLKKDVALQVGGFDEQLGAMQDFDLWIRIAQITHIGVVSKAMVNYYNYGGTNQISSMTEKYENAYKYIHEKYSDLYAKLTPREMKQRLAYERVSLGNRAMRNSSPEEARRFYWQSLKYSLNPKIFVYLMLTLFNYKTTLKLRGKMGGGKKRLLLNLAKLTAIIPDKIFLNLVYRHYTGRWINWSNPQRMSEKIQLYKAYYRNPAMLPCTDKYLVRDFVTKRLGTDKYLNELYQVCDHAEEIDFAKLPNQFVIKTTDGGSGNNIYVCKDKRDIDIPAVVKRVNSWRNKKLYIISREWAYKGAKQSRIVVEKFLEDKNNADGSINDYKFLCFDGKFRYLWVDTGRYSDFKRGWWDENLSFRKIHDNRPLMDPPIALPDNIQEMITLSEKLAAGFPHARIDWYNIGGKIIFGEITFYSWSGYSVFDPDNFDFEMGKLFDTDFKKK